MADVLFITPDTVDRSKKGRREIESSMKEPPYAFLTLGAILEKQGYSVKIIDTRIEHDFESIIRDEVSKKPIFVGINSMTGPQIRFALNICKIVRDTDAGIPIVWGGVHPSILPLQTLKNPYVDIVVINEAEVTVVKLIEALKNGDSLRDVEGIAFKENGEPVITEPIKEFVNLDDYPIPAWHLVRENFQRYLIRLFTSKGCPYECTFCYNKLYHKRRWRARSAEHVLSEIDYLIKEFGIKEIQIGDDNFLMVKDRAEKIIQGLKERGIRLKWCMTRANLLNDDILSKMSGICKEVSFGIESGSQRILDILKKELTLEQIEETVKLLKKYDIEYASGFMCGFPFETEDDLVANVNFAKKLHKIHPNHRFVIGIYVPYPGSEMYESMKKDHGLKEPDALEGWADTNQYGEINPMFIPWIKDVDFYKRYQTVFNAVFEMRDKRIKEIYKDLF